MSLLLLLVFTVSMFGSSDASWCVCNPSMGTAAMQSALDFACSHGADCNSIQPNGVCYNPNTIAAHCSYAVNSYYQRQNQAQGSCDFKGTAAVTPSDPSVTGCTYPATPSAAGTSSTPSSTTTTTTPVSSNTPPSPYTYTPTTGTTGTTGTGGVLGLGPSGTSYDENHGSSLPMAGMTTFFLVALFRALFTIRI